MIEGFDASGFTGIIDFNGAWNHGKRFFYGRVGRGVPDTATNSSGIDLRWKENRSRAIATGLKTGGYWRFFPSVNAYVQISRFVAALDLQDGMLNPLVDIEDAEGLSPQALTDWAIFILEGVEASCGRRPILYTGKNFYDTRLQYWRLWKWKLCIAWQTSGKWKEYGAHFWQYLLDTPVSWAQGRVDLQRYCFSELDYETFDNELLYGFDEDGMLHGPLVYSDKLLPESGRQGTQSNKVFIVHTMVGSLLGTDSYFRRGDIVLESNLGFGGKYDPVGYDGAIFQWMKIWDRADANYNGNPYAFSGETSDGGGNRYLEKWSPLQAESIAQSIAAWCLFTGNPVKLVDRPSSRVPGIGHHRQGTVPYPKPGDDYWSPPSEGPRACPGQPRIDQLTWEVIPRAAHILASLNNQDPTPEPPVEEDDMALDDVVGQDSMGDEITVRQALLAAYETRKEFNNIGIVLEALPEEIRKPLIQKINDLITLELFNNEQASWSEVKDNTSTWGEVNTKSWSSV